MTYQQFALASLSIIIFLTSSCLVSAEKGSCPSFPGLKEWDPQMLVGIWYLYGTTTAKEGFKCQRNELTYNKTTKTYDVTEYDGQTTKKYVMKEIGSGKFTLPDGTLIGTRFIDQTQFSLVYGCKNSGSGTYEEFEYIFTRSRLPSSSVIKRIEENSRTPLSQFKLTNEKDCSKLDHI